MRKSLFVVVLDELTQEGLDLLAQAERIEFEVRTGLKRDELREALYEADGAVCRSGVEITEAVLEGNRRLRAIVRAGVGTDNIDKRAAARRGIVVMHTPAGNTLSTAEHTFALLLALSRNLAPAHQSLVAGTWDRNAYIGSELADKTLGVVGLGRIGKEVAKRALAFQMRVLAYDPYVSVDQATELGIEPVEDVKAMLPRVDYLTVHTPLIAKTRNLIGAEEIRLLKPGARLINCARGGIYNEAALLEGIKSGRLGGIALDVHEHEPITDSPLIRLPNVLCTPHLGANTEEAQAQVSVEGVQLLIDFLTTGQIRHAVNTSSIDPTILRTLGGYIDLAYRLGLLLAQWHGGGASFCNLHYRGEVSQKDTRLLTAAFCAGLLDRALEEEVNIVNAEILLHERGIELVEESRSDLGAFSSSILVEVRVEERTYRAGGTLFGNELPRLIQLADYRLEAYLEGILLIFTHNDVPGIIGSVGTIFGKHYVNIAQMAVGRSGDAPGGDAIGVLNLDGIPPREAIAEVEGQKYVHSVDVIKLPDTGIRPLWLQGPSRA